MSSSLRLDPASFRDPESRVFTGSGEISRALSAEGVADFALLERSELLADRRVIGTERLSCVEVPLGPAREGHLPDPPPRSAPAKGVWTTYGDSNSYEPPDADAKDEFVRAVAAARTRDLVWDLGCNNGRRARIAAQHAGCAVAIDSDHGVVELLYRDLRAAADKTIVPLTVNLADASPGMGWRGAERQPLLERGRPQFVLALALVHHVVIGANVPLKDVVYWLCEIGGELVVEFPTREDPMVRAMLADKREGLNQDYERAQFEGHLGRAFEVKRSQTLSSGTRVLYHAVPLS